MLDNKLLSIYYWIFIPFVVLPQFCNCTQVKDSYFIATSSPEYFLTTKLSNANIINQKEYDDIKSNIRKISNAEINRHTTNTKLYSNAQYPIVNEKNTDNDRKNDNKNDKFTSNVLSTTGSIQDIVANHRKYLHMRFEKHKAESMKSTQYNREGKIDKKNKNNLNYDNQNYNSNNSHPKDTIKNTDAFQISFNQKDPYYQEKLYYNGDKTAIVNNPYTWYSKIIKSHKAPHLLKHHHHNHHHHRNLNKPNHHNNKWQHLSRIQSEFYYDENNGQIDEDSLPPYIKKYNRRNKQLKNLLEGTMPITTASPSAILSSQYQNKKQHHHHNKKSKSIRYLGKINGEHTKQHLRNHQKNPKWIIENLFEEQRANPNNPNSNNDDDNKDVNDSSIAAPQNSTMIDIKKMLKENQFPDDGKSAEHYEHYYDDSEEKSSISTNRNHIDGQINQQKILQNHNFQNSSKSKTFVYHRVNDPRMVGAGDTGKKQRLPFVAITDRRLENSKKLQHSQPSIFEQNNFPLP